MPKDECDTVAATVVRNMGKPADNGFSPELFLKDFNRLSPDARNVLFGGKKDLLKSLNQLSDIVQRRKDANRLGNPSGTFRGAATGAAMATSATELLSGSLLPLKTATALAGAEVVSRLMTEPSWVRMLTAAEGVPVHRQFAVYAGIKNLFPAKHQFAPLMSAIAEDIESQPSG